MTLSITILDAECRVYYRYAEYHHTECHYTECRYAECHYTESHRTLLHAPGFFFNGDKNDHFKNETFSAAVKMQNFKHQTFISIHLVKLF
jgi:hypothetical protein